MFHEIAAHVIQSHLSDICMTNIIPREISIPLI